MSRREQRGVLLLDIAHSVGEPEPLLCVRASCGAHRCPLLWS
jgi:hypothetical protein